MGIAYAKWIITAVALVYFRVSLGLVQLRWVHIWKILGAPFVVALIMYGAIALARESLYAVETGLPGRLAALTVLGAAIYITGALFACRSHVGDIMVVLSKFKK